MPWASRPATKPASTSPEPAVASQGGAFSVMEARPCGVAATVSEPFSSTIAPEAAAAALARSHFDVISVACDISLNNRANSPWCGVSTVGEPTRALIAANSDQGPGWIADGAYPAP